MNKKLMTLFAAALILFAGCSTQGGQDAGTQNPPGETLQPDETEGTVTRVASLKGPTSMGLAQLISISGEDAGYEFEMYVGADEIVPLIAKGEVDIALIPANLAATLYQRTEGEIKVIGINTMSVLNVVTGAEDVQSFADIAGRQIYMTGKGTIPEYTLLWLLEQSGISADDMQIEFKSEPTEVVSALTENTDAVAILPQPFAAVAAMQNESLHIVLNLGDVWDTVAEEGSRQVTGVTIVRNAFLAENADLVAKFLQQQQESTAFVNENPEEAAQMIEALDIVKAQVAEKAIPECNLVQITGQEMKQALSGYLQALYEIDPDAVGGELPDEAFYYLEG